MDHNIKQDLTDAKRALQTAKDSLETLKMSIQIKPEIALLAFPVWCICIPLLYLGEKIINLVEWWTTEKHQ